MCGGNGIKRVGPQVLQFFAGRLQWTTSCDASSRYVKLPVEQRLSTALSFVHHHVIMMLTLTAAEASSQTPKHSFAIF